MKIHSILTIVCIGLSIFCFKVGNDFCGMINILLATFNFSMAVIAEEI